MVQTPNIPYFKGLDMRNLQYEIRICQKSHNKVTMTVYIMVQFFMNKTLQTLCNKNSNLLFKVCNIKLNAICISENSFTHSYGAMFLLWGVC